MMVFRFLTAGWCLSLCFGFCANHFKSGTAANTLPDSLNVFYHLEHPDEKIFLKDDELREISGLSLTANPGELLAISDEVGEFYFLDAHTGAIKRRVMFRDHGDFESVEEVRDTLYALKSDGKLFQITRWDSVPQVKIYETFLRKHNDMEGMGYDPHRNALLLACKEDRERDTLRCIYAFDLGSKQLGPNPVYKIDPREIEHLTPTKFFEKQHFFSTSGVAVHPFRPEVYVISTTKKRLVALDYATGKIKFAAYLDPELLPQPEGIAFDSAGDLYLSSEGKDGVARLLHYQYTGPK